MKASSPVLPVPRAIDYRLDYPVLWEGAEVTKVTVRRPKGRDMRFIPKMVEGAMPSAEDMFPFYALLLSVPGGKEVTEEFMEEMDAADINALGEVIGGFLSKPDPKATRSSRRVGGR